MPSAIDRLAAQAENDPALTETLEHLAALPGSDPASRPPEEVRQLAVMLNISRLRDRYEGLQEATLTADEVAEQVGDFVDREEVDRAEKRGDLLSRAGEGGYFRWQFDLDSGVVHPGLRHPLDALAELKISKDSAHFLATTGRPEAGGESPADLLASGNVAAAVTLIQLAGDQS